MELNDARDLAINLMQFHNLDSWNFSWINLKKVHGRCIYQPRIIALSIPYVIRMTEAQVKNVILHEIAHAIAGPYVDSHGPEWRAIAASIGANPRARTRTGIQVEGKYIAECPNPRCRKTYYAHKLRRRISACRMCCEKYNYGKYSSDFVLIFRPNHGFSS